MKEITIFYDYVCPYCLLAKVPFEEAVSGKEVSIRYIPYELTPETEPGIDIVNDKKRRKDWENIIIPQSEKYNIGMRVPNIIPRPYTALAIEGSYVARKYKKESEYHSRVMKAYFVEEQNIGTIEVLLEIASSLGIPQEEFRSALVDRIYANTRIQDVKYAKETMNVTSIPTYIIDGIRVVGEYEIKAYEEALK